MDKERFDRIVVARASNGHDGFTPDDIAWLLEQAPSEIVILRPSREVARLNGRAVDERREDRVRRVFFRMPEHAQREAPVG